MNSAARAELSSSRVAHQHRRRAGVGLDVVGLVAEALEAEQVVEVLPDDAGHRHLGHHPQQDDLRSGLLGRAGHQVPASCHLPPDDARRSSAGSLWFEPFAVARVRCPLAGARLRLVQLAVGDTVAEELLVRSALDDPALTR